MSEPTAAVKNVMQDYFTPKGIACLTFDNMGSARDVGLGKIGGPDPADPGLCVGNPTTAVSSPSLTCTAPASTTTISPEWNAFWRRQSRMDA